MMNDEFSSSSGDIRAEACAWIAQLETGDLTRADIDAFREWTHRSPRHADEVRKLAELSADLNVLTALSGAMKAAAAKYTGVVESKQRKGWAGLRTLSAATVAVLLAVVLFVMRPFSTEVKPDWPVVLSTGVGQYLEHRLPDGSVLALNTDTQLEVTYTDLRRQVFLRHGEALFTVARNPEKPFIVYTGGKSVEAVGTIFLVRNDAETFEVAVTEGRVRLETVSAPVSDTRADAGTHSNEGEQSDRAAMRDALSSETAALPTDSRTISPVVLDAGQHVSLQVLNMAVEPVMPAIEVISPLDIRRKLAWRDGLLDFSDTPLDEVVREVSRHTTLQIEIADPTLAQVRFGGVFRAGDTEPLFRALESAYDIQAEYIDRDTVRLTRSKLQ